MARGVGESRSAIGSPGGSGKVPEIWVGRQDRRVDWLLSECGSGQQRERCRSAAKQSAPQQDCLESNHRIGLSFLSASAVTDDFVKLRCPRYWRRDSFFQANFAKLTNRCRSLLATCFVIPASEALRASSFRPSEALPASSSRPSEARAGIAKSHAFQSVTIPERAYALPG